MLTPDDMQKKIFALGRRLENNDVGIFVKEVQINYQFLYDQVEEQKKQIKGMESKLAHYRKIESSLQEALVSAERVSENKIHEAEKKSRQIEKTAYRKADEILEDAKRELAHIKGLISDFENEYKEYQDKYFDFVQGQISFIEEAKRFVLDEKIDIDEYKSREDDGLFNDVEMSSSIKFEDVVVNNKVESYNKSDNAEKIKSIQTEEKSKSHETVTNEKIEIKDTIVAESEEENDIDDKLNYEDLNTVVEDNEKMNYDDLDAEDTVESPKFDNLDINNISEDNVADNQISDEISDSESELKEPSEIDLNKFEEASMESSTMFDNEEDLLSQGIVDNQKMPEDFTMPDNIPNFDEVPDFNIPNSTTEPDTNMDFSSEQALGQKEPDEFNPDDVFTLPDIDLDFPEFKEDEDKDGEGGLSESITNTANEQPSLPKEADLSMNSNVELKYANDSFLSGLKKKQNEKESILASLNLSSNKDDNRERIKDLERSYTKDLLESNKALLNSGNIEKGDDEASLPRKEDIANRRSMFAMQSERK